MTTITITYRNFSEKPIYLQIDPWAGIYLLKKDESIEIVAMSETTSPSFDFNESKEDFRSLTIGYSDEYYVVVDGQRVHCSQYMSNLPD